MPITAKCPNARCGKSMKVRDEFAGRKAKCPACASVFLIPGGPAAPAPIPVVRVTRPGPVPATPGPRGVVLMFVGLGLLVALAASVFLPWMSVTILGPTYSVSGFKFPGGLLVLVLALAAAGLIGAFYFLKMPLSLVLQVGGLAGTASLLTVLGVLFKVHPGLGLWIALVGSAGAAATLILCSLLNPYRFPPLQKEGTSPFLRNHGGLLGFQGIALVLGLILMFVGTGASVSMADFGGPPDGFGGPPGVTNGGRNTSGMQIPNMQMPNMQMPNVQMPNVQMPNMQMPNMKLPAPNGFPMPSR